MIQTVVITVHLLEIRCIDRNLKHSFRKRAQLNSYMIVLNIKSRRTAISKYQNQYQNIEYQKNIDGPQYQNIKILNIENIEYQNIKINIKILNIKSRRTAASKARISRILPDKSKGTELLTISTLRVDWRQPATQPPGATG